MSVRTDESQDRREALERLVSGNNTLRVVAGWLRRIGWQFSPEEERSVAAGLAARMNGTRAPKRELTPEEWGKIGEYVERAIGRYDEVLAIARRRGSRQ